MPTLAKRFDLLRSFGLLSLLSIGLIALVVGYAASAYLTDRLLERDAAVSRSFLELVVSLGGEAHGDRAGSVLELQSRLQDVFPRIASMQSVVRANLYDPDGVVVWSTEASLEGERFRDNDDLARALRGQLVYELQDLDDEHKAEYQAFAPGVERFVENYIPLRGEDGSVLGVMEIYKTPEALLATLRQAGWRVWFGTFLAGLFLYAVQFGIVFRANRLIRDQQERLVEAETLAAVGEMASAMAHSVRNPLAAIRSGAELTAEMDQLEDMRELAEDVVAETDRLEQRIRELLVYAGSGAQPGEFQPVSLSGVLEDCLQGFSRSMARRQVELSLELDPQAPRVAGDPVMLAQMFNSLIANALEAMYSGGRLRVREHHDRARRTVQMTISDTGAGIPPERLARVFAPLSTQKRGGLGLGLALVKRIVERHQGSVELESELSVGTTVLLRFPAAG